MLTRQGPRLRPRRRRPPRAGRAQTRIDLARFSAVRGADRLALAGPATVTLDGGSAVIDSLVVAAGSGPGQPVRPGRPDLDLKLGIRGLPLALARIASPGLPLTGTLDGEADLRGSADRPEGRYALTRRPPRHAARPARPASRPSTPGLAAPSSDGRAGIDGRVSAGRGAEMTLSGSLPVAAGGALAVKVRGTLDAALANSLLSVGGQRVAGRIAIDAGVAGTAGRAARRGRRRPSSGGTFTDPLQGIRLTNIEGRVTGRGDTLVVERLTAQTRNGGTLRARRPRRAGARCRLSRQPDGSPPSGPSSSPARS